MIQAKVYKLGKSEYAISKAGKDYQVFRLVRKHWQLLASYASFNEARLFIFTDFAVDKGMVTI